jgi:hypothetical protein
MFNIYDVTGEKVGEADEFVDACSTAIDLRNENGSEYVVMQEVWSTTELAQDEELAQAA